MLPEAKSYLKKGGYSDQPAGFILMACFVAGFIGIQVISRLFHQLLPSHVVDCDHSHNDHGVDDQLRDHANGHGRRQSTFVKGLDRQRHSIFRRKSTVAKSQLGSTGLASESTPLLSSAEPHNGQIYDQESTDAILEEIPSHDVAEHLSRRGTGAIERRPSMIQVQKRVMSFVKDTKPNCDESGPCYGYSDPCGQECFKHISNRPGGLISRAPTFLRTTTGLVPPRSDSVAIAEEDEDHLTGSSISPTAPRSTHADSHSHAHSHGEEEDHEAEEGGETVVGEPEPMDDIEAQQQQQHHHHVPENAFLAIGLQTSIAIALHKFPEGFITYATNHANPSLGFNVFLALAVHNISEGFAMALPLYMALHSRGRAIAWSAALGGLSQPFGAAIAALWFKLASHTRLTPDAAAYGCLFALTAGIMASVALQLFVESLTLNHDRNLSILFAFLGMTLLGTSNAFTSDAH